MTIHPKISILNLFKFSKRLVIYKVLVIEKDFLIKMKEEIEGKKRKRSKWNIEEGSEKHFLVIIPIIAP